MSARGARARSGGARGLGWRAAHGVALIAGLACAPERARAAPVSIAAVDAAGKPLTSAQAVLDPLGSAIVVRASGEGRLNLDAGAGDLACVTAPGYVAVELTVGSMASDGRVVLAPGGEIAGVVTEARGVPLEGVRVRLRVAPSLAPCASASVTGAAGRYRIDGAPAGRVELAVEPGPTHLGVPARAVRLVGAEALRLDLRLHAACRISATAVDPAGAPLPGATVRILPEWSRFPPLGGDVSPDLVPAIESFTEMSSALGGVALPPLPQRASWRIAVAHPDHAPSSFRVAAERGAVAERFVLLRGGDVTLRAVDDHGLPRPSPEYRLFCAGAPDLDLLPEPKPGSPNGVLSIRHLPAATYTLELRAKGARPRVLRGVNVKDGAVTALGDVALEAGAAVAGTVQSDSGDVVRGAEVRLDSHVEGRRLRLRTTTDAAGAFRFDGLDPDTRADLLARAAGRVEAKVENVPAGTLDAVLELAPAGAVVVTIRSATTGEAIDSADATITSHADDQLRRLRGEAGASPGRVRFDGLAGGAYTLRVSAPGHAAMTPREVEVAAGGEPLEVDVELEPGLRVGGRVVDASASLPVAAATVAIRGSSATTQADGSFVLEAQPGMVDVVATHPLYQRARLPAVEVSPDRPPLELRLERGGTLEGTVFGSGGEPQAGATVSIHDLGKSTLSEAGGRYVLDGLTPGTRLATKRSHPTGYDGLEEAVVDIRVGSVTRHDFGVAGRLHGTVTRDGRPVAGAQLTIMAYVAQPGADPDSSREVQQSLACASRDDGSYALSGVQPGRHVLMVRWQERTFGRDVEYPEGVRELRVDVEIPDLHLAGLVVDAETGQPIPGAEVVAEPAEPRTRSATAVMQDDASDFELAFFATVPQSKDVTDLAGRYRLLLARPGPYQVRVHARGWSPPSPGDKVFEVTSSRDDVVLELERRQAADLTVRLVDAASRELVPTGSVYLRSKGGSSTHAIGTDTGVVRFDPAPAGAPITIIGLAEGHAPSWRRDVTLERGSGTTIDLLMPIGGSLRLLVPPNALQLNAYRGIDGRLAIVEASGVDLMRLTGMPGGALAGEATQVGPTEWLFAHLPEGRHVVTVDTGAAVRSAEVDVREGDVAEADLR